MSNPFLRLLKGKLLWISVFMLCVESADVYSFSL